MKTTLTVSIIEAKNLCTTTEEISAILSCTNIQFATQFVSATKSHWNETFIFELDEGSASLCIHLMTRTGINVGSTHICLPDNSMTTQQATRIVNVLDAWFDLHPTSGSGAPVTQINGNLRVKLSLNSKIDTQKHNNHQNGPVVYVSTLTSYNKDIYSQITPPVDSPPRPSTDSPNPLEGSPIIERPPITIRLVDLIQEIKKCLPQIKEEDAIRALRASEYHVENAIELLVKELIDCAGNTPEAAQLFSTAVYDMFAPQMSSFLSSYPSMYSSISPTTVNRLPDQSTPVNFQPSGRRKALLIGCNYPQSKEALKGCVEDVMRIRTLITGIYGFLDQPNTMTILIDSPLIQFPRRTFYPPTKRNIMRAIQWLVNGAAPGDCLFFHFSGHGSQTLSLRPQFESDLLDETILPCDWKTAGHIIDDELNQELIQHIPEGVKLTAILDCCHSGTGMDLPYVYKEEEKHWVKSNAPLPPRGDVQLFSGCRSDERSADVYTPRLGAGGVLTFAIVTALAENPFHLRYTKLLDRIHKVLRYRGFTQAPQLSSSHPFDVSKYFR